MSQPPANSFAFPSTLRLRSKSQFDHVFAGNCSTFVYPLRIYARPNGLPHCRLGLVASRRVGSAPVRNRAKRMMRESFRLLQHDLPAGYDLVVIMTRHHPLTLADYQRLLRRATDALHQQWHTQPSS